MRDKEAKGSAGRRRVHEGTASCGPSPGQTQFSLMQGPTRSTSSTQRYGAFPQQRSYGWAMLSLLRRQATAKGSRASNDECHEEGNAGMATRVWRVWAWWVSGKRMLERIPRNARRSVPTSATAVVEKIAGDQKTNTSITVPVDWDQKYYNNATFAAVSTLYLLEPPHVFCNSFTVNGDYTGTVFSVGCPCSLSTTSTVQIGYLRCFYEE
ncbi:hypothetical protein GGR57DRAFT_507180 [Xylariaceae sp. FL1272]|nr:hypothetical protein GGR57DRAFT_507180 [Xylariaceae sp. FL1272]